jgi:hypothetical protein
MEEENDWFAQDYDVMCRNVFNIHAIHFVYSFASSFVARHVAIAVCPVSVGLLRVNCLGYISTSTKMICC